MTAAFVPAALDAAVVAANLAGFSEGQRRTMALVLMVAGAGFFLYAWLSKPSQE